MSSFDPSARLTFIGCYTAGAGGAGDGIVRVGWDRRTGALGDPVVVATTPSPSFLLRHPEHPVLYAANELADGQVSAYAVASDGDLDPLGSWPSGGADPCHLGLDSTGAYLLIANYGSGTVTAHALDGHGVPTGRHHGIAHSGRSKDPERQDRPHAHMVAAVDGGVLSVDLGTDSVYRHPLDPATGRLGEGEVAVRVPPGTGPRHLARDAAGRLYLVGELDGSLTTYRPGSGGFAEVAHVPTSVDQAAMPSGITVSEDGRLLYVANRGPDTLTTFSLVDGVPTRVGEVPTGGSWPRQFAVVDGFLAVANERSHSVVTFRRDAATGLPTPTGDILSTPSPTCVLPW